MYSTPLDKVLEALRAAGCEPRQNGHDGSYHACCPAHGDKRPSLSLSRGEDGRALIFCHAGCDTKGVCDALGIKPRDLFPRQQRKATKQGGWASLEDVTAWLERKNPGDSVTCHKYHEEGRLVGAVLRIDNAEGGKTILPARLRGGAWELKAMPAPRPLYNLPALLAASADQIVFAVEGEKCCDALAAIGLLATTSAGGSQAACKSDWSTLAGRRVVVLPDHDDAGAKYAREVAKLLKKAGADARILNLADHCPGLPEGGDVADVLASPDWCGLLLGNAATPQDFVDWLNARAEELLSGIDQAAHATGDAVGGPNDGELADLADAAAEANERRKPTILVTCEEHAVINAMLDLLPLDDQIYNRGGVLCAGRGTKLVPLTAELLSEAFTRLARFKSKKQRGDDETVIRVHPPRWATRAILDRQHWPGVREVRGVVNWPIINSRGEIVANGYDPVSQVLVVDAPQTALGAGGDVVQAADKLLDVIYDFPFLKVDDRTAWLAALLTGLVRFACEGPVPLFVIEANCQGTGKTLLADVLGVLLTGETLPRMPWTRDGDEARKRITSVALRGEPLMLLDNITHTIGGSELAALLTGTRWTDRLLGSNSTLSCRVDTVWIATSNGAAFDPDMARRVLPIRLETDLEHPEQRTGFRHPRLLEYVKQHRAELLGAALTILRGWIDAGKPLPVLPPFGSYEGWSDWVRGPLVWMGLPDPIQTRDGITQSTPERQAVFELASWIESHRIFDHDPWPTAAELVAQARLDANSGLREAIEVLCGTLDARRLGNKLKPWLRRNVGGKRIVPLTSKGGIYRYKVESVQPDG